MIVVSKSALDISVDEDIDVLNVCYYKTQLMDFEDTLGHVSSSLVGIQNLRKIADDKTLVRYFVEVTIASHTTTSRKRLVYYYLVD